MLRKVALPLFCSTLLIILTLFVLQRPAAATSETISTVINVNTFVDVLNNDGFCSLREAVIAANTNTASGATAGECPAGSGNDTINLSNGTYQLTIDIVGTDTPVTGDLDIDSELSIQGSTAGNTIVDSNVYDRIIEITSSGKATISNLWIQGGQENGYSGGGIMNSGQLTLTKSLFIANLSSSSGGGLFNSIGATALLKNVSFGNNISSNGAGIQNSGTILLDHVSLDFGTASGIGGGIANQGYATLQDVNVSFNTAEVNGGGISNSGIITLTRVTSNDNTVTNGNGGGFWNNSLFSLVNVTLSGNQANNGLGGGYFQSSAGGSFTNVTIANNTAGLGGGLYAVVTGLSMRNTLVVDNPLGGNCRVDTGTVTSLGNNLSSDNTCNLAFNQASDQNNITNPKVGPLANHGGATETHALLTGSLAIDHGSNTGCPEFDQRGFQTPGGWR